MDCTLTKKNLRKTMLAQRARLAPAEKGQMDRQIASNIANSELWRKAGSVYLYVSLPAEAATGQLLDLAWRQGKRVGLPRICGLESAKMEFRECPGWTRLEKGPFSLLEPDSNCPPAPAPDLILLPGLAFDPQGGRLGYGKGFYDRYLASQDISGCFLAGLCYCFQLLEFVPAEITDVPVNVICTEKGFICL